jgi:hypothetical protein
MVYAGAVSVVLRATEGIDVDTARQMPLDGRPGNHAAIVRLRVPPITVLWVLLGIATTLAVVSAVISSARVLGADLPYDALSRFDVDGEMTVPAWFSALDFFFCALLMVAIAQREHGHPFVRYWWVLAAGFTILSLDEAVSLHEAVNDRIKSTFASAPAFAWAIPGMLLAAAVGLCFVPFLRHLPRRYASLFLVAGTVYVFAAGGLDLIAGKIIDAHGGEDIETSSHNFPYVAETTIEEFLEMASVAVFVFALLTYIEGVGTRDAGGRDAPEDLRA